ncbi:hypothetical protein J2R76_004703 [Bradyrhizobium sp. USDA 4532]|uniref:hypothetical protein n=1 Tax=unclassified Bradyrhizobium TaxID=2631580 RepID=UPI00209D2292|nr:MULTISPECIES: hypothetical protein [unclassified Bradyrhizobium]MCP1836363.1 hypothetical protein [Bradyrhizobium sp. USDA 4545]MCP1921112.1 hypothetical protein [Bradyrhizobium sp. USDA 4532]
MERTLGNGPIVGLVLGALVRTLLVKNVLSSDDVWALLFEAATCLDVDGDPQTPQAAKIMVDEDLAPVFLGDDKKASIDPHFGKSSFISTPTEEK